jgi:hypothetical protein
VSIFDDAGEIILGEDVKIDGVEVADRQEVRRLLTRPCCRSSTRPERPTASHSMCSSDQRGRDRLRARPQRLERRLPPLVGDHFRAEALADDVVHHRVVHPRSDQGSGEVDGLLGRVALAVDGGARGLDRQPGPVARRCGRC